ncbi:MAG: hypothetical protein ACSHXL_00810, partial [Bacteroidota bacterium]
MQNLPAISYVTAVVISLLFASSLSAQDEEPTINKHSLGYTYDWSGKDQRSYFIQWSTDLEEFSYFPVIRSGTGDPISHGFQSSESKFFLRLKYTDLPDGGDVNAADFDNDGISNLDEITYSFMQPDPFEFDTDGDGQGDWQEIASDKDPTDPSSYTDDFVLTIHQGAGTVYPYSLLNLVPEEVFSLNISDDTSWLSKDVTSTTGEELEFDLTYNTDLLATGLTNAIDLTLTNSVGVQVYTLPLSIQVAPPATEGDDILDGTEGHDFGLNGLGGNDTISGGFGDDVLEGGDGDDTIDGDNGYDILTGGLGNDTLDGGHGDDLYIISSGEGPDLIEEVGISARDVVSINGLYWSDLTLVTLSTEQIELSAGGAVLCTIDRYSELASYPSLKFEDGSLATWNVYSESYDVTADSALNTYPDTNLNGVADWYERLVLGVLDPILDTADANVPPNEIEDWWEYHHFGGLVAGGDDFDNDGLTNKEEWDLKTDPTLADTDGDGVNDGIEVANGLQDPLVSDAYLEDADLDGLATYLEEIYATDPAIQDSDNDGFFDGAEVLAGTDPTDPSSRPFQSDDFLGSPINDINCQPIGDLGVDFKDTINPYVIDLGAIVNVSFYTWALPSRRYYGYDIYLKEAGQNNNVFTDFVCTPGIYHNSVNVEGSKNYSTAHEATFRSETIPRYDSSNLSTPYMNYTVDYYASPISHLVFGLFAAAPADQFIQVSSEYYDTDNRGFKYFFPISFSSWAASYSGSDAVGPVNRKVGINGRPLPDAQPEQESESDSHSEQTYVDAFNLQLRHDNSFAYINLGASDLVIEANSSVQETTWNHRSGLRPEEQLTLPFGVGWTSNLCSYIEIIESVGQKNNDPISVNVVDEGGRSQRFGTNDLNEFFPWPSTNVDKKTYLNTLVKSGNTFVLQKKHGNKLTYESSDAWFTYSSDREDGSSSIRKHTYWRLATVEDKFETVVDYDYGTSDISLIPQKISSSSRPDQWLSVIVSPNCRRVDSITDGKGNTVEFHYTDRTISKPVDIGLNGGAQTFEYTTLDSVDYDDGTSILYTYETVRDPEIKDDVTTHHFHSNLKTIEDKRGNIHTFNYTHDRTREYFSGYNSTYSFNAAIDSNVPDSIRLEAEAKLDALNKENWPGGQSDYSKQHGLPRQITSIELPNNLGTSYFTKTSASKLTYGPEFSAVTGTIITDAEGNETHYDFNNVQGKIINSSYTYSNGGSSRSDDWMIYYTQMQVHHGARPSSVGYLGTETFEYNSEAGLALSKTVDISGNQTQWTYSDPISSGAVMPNQDGVSFMTTWSDPTSKTDALGRVETYRYSDNYRVMDQLIDVHGTTTTFGVDSMGRRTSKSVVGSAGNVLRQEIYNYDDASLPGFQTKSTVKAYSSISGQSWETDLVTQYVPDASSGMVQDVIADPSVLALTTSYTYDANNNKTSVTDARNNATIFSYDKLNRLTDVIYPVAGTSTGNGAATKEILYDANSNKAAEIDEEGNYRIYFHDALNRVTHAIIDMDGTGLPVKNGNGIVTESNRGSITSSDLAVSTTYNAVNSPEIITDAHGVKTLNTYDVLQRLTHVYGNWESGDTEATRTASTEKTHLEYKYLDAVTIGGTDYDANPGASGFSSSGFTPTVAIQHDAVLTQTGTQSFTSYKFNDAVYRPIETHTQFQTSGASFDENYLSTSMTYGVGSAAASKESLVTRSVDDLGKTTQTLADGLGRNIEVINALSTPLESITSTYYSSTGLTWKVIDPEDRVSEMEYDAVGRPVKVWEPDPITGLVDRSTPSDPLLGSPLTETAYDANSNVISTTNPLEHVWDFIYDARNRKISELQPAVTNAEDPATTVINIRPQTTITYDGVGNVLSTQDARGYTTRNFYDQAYRVTDSLSNPVTGNPSSDLGSLNPNDILTSSSYDDNGNILALTDANDNITRNAYDALNRLVITTTDSVDGDPD